MENLFLIDAKLRIFQCFMVTPVEDAYRTFAEDLTRKRIQLERDNKLRDTEIKINDATKKLTESHKEKLNLDKKKLNIQEDIRKAKKTKDLEKLHKKEDQIHKEQDQIEKDIDRLQTAVNDLTRDIVTIQNKILTEMTAYAETQVEAFVQNYLNAHPQVDKTLSEMPKMKASGKTRAGVTGFINEIMMTSITSNLKQSMQNRLFASNTWSEDRFRDRDEEVEPIGVDSQSEGKFCMECAEAEFTEEFTLERLTNQTENAIQKRKRALIESIEKYLTNHKNSAEDGQIKQSIIILKNMSDSDFEKWETKQTENAMRSLEKLAKGQ